MTSGLTPQSGSQNCSDAQPAELLLGKPKLVEQPEVIPLIVHDQ